MRKLLILTLVMVFVIGLIPTVCASQDSMKVVLCVGNPGDDDDYEIGDDVPITVYVFDKGVLTDADAPPIVTLNKYDASEREITVQKTGTGEYGGSFTIMESDVEYGSHIEILAEATKGNDEDTDYGSVWLNDEEGLNVEIEFEASDVPYIEASPGDTIDMTITVEDNGVKINPDSFNLIVYDNGNRNPLSYTNPSIGVYKASYTVNSTIAESKYIHIEAEAEYNNGTDRDDVSILVTIYSIWCHLISVTDTSAQFEICVADMEGKAISGVDIEFEYEIDWEDIGQRSGTTDSQGKTSFTIDYDSAEDIDIDGTAKYSGKTQHFDGYIEVEEEEPDIEEPSPNDDFQVIYQENAGDIEPGDTVAFEYIAYEEAEPLPDQPIYYYIYTEKQFIKSGSTTTNSNGGFTVTFTVPETMGESGIVAFGELRLAFESPFEDGEDSDSDDGFVYREDSDYTYIQGSYLGEPDESIIIETSPLKIGGKTNITVTVPNSEGYLGIATIFPGEYTFEDLLVEGVLSPEWIPWTSPFQFYNYLIPENGKFTGGFILPEFLPKDETYTVSVLFGDPEEPYVYRWNYAHVKPGESVKPDVEDENPLLKSMFEIAGIGIPLLAIIIIVAIILVVLVFGIKRARGKAKPIQPSQPPPQAYQQPYPPQYPQQGEGYQGGYMQPSQYPPAQRPPYRRYPPPPP